MVGRDLTERGRRVANNDTDADGNADAHAQAEAYSQAEAQTGTDWHTHRDAYPGTSLRQVRRRRSGEKPNR
jgi:hypothetical protein